jgi:hypothetical protein
VIPRDLDVVRLRRALFEHELAAGSVGAVVNDYQEPGVAGAYLVEFTDAAGYTQALVTVREGDLEVVSRTRDSDRDR